MRSQIKFPVVFCLCLYAGFFNVFYGCHEKFVYHDKKAPDKNLSCVKYYDTSLNIYVFESADKMPEFRGGQEELFKFISTNFKRSNSQEETQGKVCVSFTIMTDGKIVNERICNKSPESYTELDKSGIEFIKKTSGKWIPGKCNDLKVAVKYVLPIYVR